jgi:hypothetical protein
MQIPTFHDPGLSLLQSALHQVLVKRGEPNTAHLSAGHPAMRAVVAAGLQYTQPGQPTSLDRDAEILLACARLAVEYATTSGTARQLVYDELTGAACDPLWTEAITTYELLQASGAGIPYVPYDPATQPNPPMALPGDTVSIALLADWGMGTPVAENVLAQAATALSAGDPPVQQAAASLLIHMGDIYYAGTTPECEAHFVDTVLSAVPTAFTPEFPVYAIPGNHEYYSGAQGYYGTVLPRLAGQTNSFFCLRTDQWQVVALDTGYNDRDPWTVSTNLTSLTADQEAWLKGVMASAGGRGTILLTHHQLFSAAGSVGTANGVLYGISPNLYQQLSPYFDQIAVWLWGHEHNTVIFKPETGLPLGRCIGSASIPMLVVQDPYEPAPGLQGVAGLDVPCMEPIQLSNNGTDYAHGFAVLSLAPEQATVNYYQVPLPTAEQITPPTASWLYGESFTAPSPLSTVPITHIPQAALPVST